MFKDRYITTDDGLQLHLRDYPPEAKDKETLPLICLPGLSRNVRDFHKLAVRLNQNEELNFRIISLDYRGRGLSDWDKNTQNYNIIREADDVLLALEKLGIKKANFIGTSRGGLIIHMIATKNIAVINSIIFNDIGPEIEINGLLKIKSYLAKSRLPKNWQDAALLQKELHEDEFPDLEDIDWQDMARDIYVEKNGHIVPDFDHGILYSIIALDENTTLPTLWEQFKLLHRIPMLTLRGKNSELFSDKTLSKMDDDHPNHIAATISNHGHPPILHLPEPQQIISSFLKNLEMKKPA